jgi:hypothetical protein
MQGAAQSNDDATIGVLRLTGGTNLAVIVSLDVVSVSSLVLFPMNDCSPTRKIPRHAGSRRSRENRLTSPLGDYGCSFLRVRANFAVSWIRQTAQRGAGQFERRS